MSRALNRRLMQFTKRAEAEKAEVLVDTFVDAGPLFTLLRTIDHQVVYGRRGTGKTHALVYLAQRVEEDDDWGIFIDLRQIGSSGGLYGDGSLPISERGTRLLLDVLAAIQSSLVDRVLEAADTEEHDFTAAFRSLDDLAEEITTVEVRGPVEVEERRAEAVERGSGAMLDVSLTGATASVGTEEHEATTQLFATRRIGTEHHHVHFGGVGAALARLMTTIPSRQVWILLDEWSTIPLELQPILADLLRRSLFAVPGVTVKVAAIEHRSRLREARPNGDYLGIEVGADAAANVDLDDFMVFGNNADQAQTFFRELLFRHLVAGKSEPLDGEEPLPANADEFVAKAFTQSNTFDELVRAAEGVPRDAINVIALAAQLADESSIAINHVRDAARRWYQRDKEAALAADKSAETLLHWIIDQVIAGKRTKGFLLDPRGIHDENVRSLYDSRVLHLIRRGISSRDAPGVRFNAYALDFGCYVHLTAARAPRSLFQVEDENGFVEVQVPDDDYRSIRTAVLDLDDFYQSSA